LRIAGGKCGSLHFGRSLEANDLGPDDEVWFRWSDFGSLKAAAPSVETQCFGCVFFYDLRLAQAGLEQKQILRLTTPKFKKTLGAPFAQDDRPEISRS